MTRPNSVPSSQDRPRSETDKTIAKEPVSMPATASPHSSYTNKAHHRAVLRGILAALVALIGCAVLAPATYAQAIEIESFDGGVFHQNGTAVKQAGSHPHTGSARIDFVAERRPNIPGSGADCGVDPAPVPSDCAVFPVASAKDITAELPAGFVGDPNATPKCTTAQLAANLSDPELACPPEAQVGVLSFDLTGQLSGDPISAAVYNLEPPPGVPAMFGTALNYVGTVLFKASVRSDGDYGVNVDSIRSPQAAGLLWSDVEFWGVPADPAHDSQRGISLTPNGAQYCAYVPTGPGCPFASSAPRRPLLSLPSSCVGPVETRIRLNSWEEPGIFDNASFFTHEAGDPGALIGNEGCGLVPFEPSASFDPSSTAPGSASGLDVGIDLPQSSDPDGLATAHLKDTVVTLPEGMSVNPSAAAGLEGCSDEQVGVRGYGFEMPAPTRFNDEDPFDGEGVECPDGSKIGSVVVTTPVLDETLTGDVVLGTPKSTDPESGQMLRLFLVIRNKERGLLVKVHGTTTADRDTGQLRATFESNPQLPFSDLDVKFKGGDRGVIAMPQTCGQRSTEAVFTPWTAFNGGGGLPKGVSDPIVVGGDCSFGFGPGLAAGMDTSAARANGKFSFRFSRKDGEQWLRGLTAKLPTGLLASVKDLPLCSNAQADAGACPATSKIGLVDAKAGAGEPFVLEQKGEVFLTEGYKGGEYGLAVKVRPVAGPFRGAMELSPIIVRQAIHVDRTSAQVTAVSDPFPLVHHGVPLRVREVTVLVDREKFMLNPSDCAGKQVGADIVSAQGTVAGASNAFQASGCAALAFKPKLGLSLTGRKQVRTGRHPGIKAVVTQKGVGEAGIEKAEVRLPKSLALDVNNAGALCEFADGTKPDLENHCPKGSIVGRARATSPLLNDPLVGNVYFVKNIRKDPKTGNEIRTLPMIIVALRGEIAINLKGESDTTRAGKLVNTFDNVPDAPVSKFNLNIKGGSKGILAVTRTRRSLINLCAKPNGHTAAEADMDGHNGRRYDRNIRMKTPCTKRQTKQAKRAAKRDGAPRR